MKRLLFISVVIAMLASLFASTKPDGLDHVSNYLGFSSKAVYHASALGGISGAMAGISGVLITMSMFWLLIFVIKRCGSKNSEQS